VSDIISITGTVATEPRHVVTNAGVRITTFRLASGQRRYDRAESKWVEAPTNWYSVSTFSALAINAAASLRKGERVVVRGRLQIRDWESETRSGTTVEVVAESIGHDLLWGTTAFTRVAGASARGGGEEVGSAEGAAEASTSTSSPPSHDADGWAVPGSGTDGAPGVLTDVPF
jgi:single-strand DNA-binding protein